MVTICIKSVSDKSCCISSVPNQVRQSRSSEPRVLNSSHSPSCRRMQFSATRVLNTVMAGPIRIASDG
ncbi:hypothetical protein CQY23_03240 [Mycobacterium celatum]|uniref:Uncharacterized protein n=1 Tax=Mycobacterium celatum TaxID=28045 RepID=A0A2G5PQN0_MYCCE|nr:hypothetical protein CQY23_03240 [Mycobacterium celatum]